MSTFFSLPILGQSMFIHQQNVELTIPLMLDSFDILDAYPIIRFTFTDLEANASTKHKFSLRREFNYLKINETTGELFFNQIFWNERKQTKKLYVTVGNVETEHNVSTSLTLNFIKTNLVEFCSQYFGFYDKIHYVAEEFDHLKNGSQMIGDLNPVLYQHICYSMETDCYLVNGKINNNHLIRLTKTFLRRN